MVGLLVITTADTVGPEEVVIVVVEEHVTAFARSSASGVILDVRCGTGCFCCCRVEFDLVDITPERTEVEIVVAANCNQVRINLRKFSFSYS
jgi:hypothetical protein